MSADQQFAVKVTDASMDMARLLPGEFAVFIPYWRARSEARDGDIVVAGQPGCDSADLLVRRLSVSSGRIELWPVSSDQRFQEPVRIGADESGIDLIGFVTGSYAILTPEAF